jgi:hypothetical protein
MFSFFNFGKFSRVAVFLHDGSNWYAYAFSYKKSYWHLLSHTNFFGKNSRQIPSQLFEFAETHGVRRIRVILSQNIHKLDDIELPFDAMPEELQTIVSLAYTQVTGHEYGTVRVASAFADTFRMGGTSESLFAAGIETAQLEQYDKSCQVAGFRFDGCGVLELAAVAVGTKYFDETRFLILRRDKGFYITCALGDVPMTTSGIALNSPNDDKTRDTERIQVISRRLNTQKMIPLQIWYTTDVEQKKLDEIRESIDPDTQATFTDLTQYSEEIARKVAETTEIGIPTDGGAIVGLPEKEKDPYRAGTWLFGIAILLALLLTLATYQKLHADMKKIKNETDAWEKLRNERKKLNDKLTAIDNERKKNEQIIEILNRKNPLPIPLVSTLIELNKNMPDYTKLTEIEQINDDELILTGYTLYQEGFIKLQPDLNKKLNKYKMQIELQSLEKIENSKEQKFILRIYNNS